jgi:NADH-quinone oxidoreductase subunit N
VNNNDLILSKAQLGYYLPEAILAAIVLLLVILSCFKGYNPKINFWLSLLGVLIYLTMLSFKGTGNETQDFRSNLDIKFSYLMCIAYFLAQSISFSSKEEKHNIFGQIATLSFLLGCLLLPLSTNFLTIYLLVEFISVSAYFLVTINNSQNSNEGALKYLILGGVSSAVMLYGISLQYGISGNFEFVTTIHSILAHSLINDIAGICIILGLLFKLGAFPMHSWVADIYESSSKSTIAAISFIPKASACLILIRIFPILINASPSVLNFSLLLVITGITYGNILAIQQTSMMRMLGYSSIAQVSLFLLLALSGVSVSETTILYVLVAYGLSTIGFIAWIAAFYQDIDDIKAFSGLSAKNPIASIILLVLLLNLVGLPPLIGFTAKLLLFSTTYESYSLSANSLWVTAISIALLNTAISLFYYVKPSFYQYFKAELNGEKTWQFQPFLLALAGSLAISALILFFIPIVIF